MTTEQNTPSTPVDEATTVVEPSPAVESQQQPEAKHQKVKNSGAVLGSIALVLVIALGGFSYYHSHQQSQALSSANQLLQQQVTKLIQDRQQGIGTLQQQLQEQFKQLQQQLEQQSQALANSKNAENELNARIEDLQRQLAATSGSQSDKSWLLAQANFLLNTAGRKLWSDQDLATAIALLKSADASLVEMHDPSLRTLRLAIQQDIGTLQAVTQTDFDGLTLQLNQLANQVDNLRLIDNNKDERPMEPQEGELSTSLGEWRQNLTKSWHSFMADFITIRRRDSITEPLLAPNQDIYLRENIRARLLIAMQAVERHQNELYSQSLATVSTWSRSYFEPSDPATQAFLTQLEQLQQQSVALDLPQQLTSPALLEKLLKSRGQSTSPRAITSHREE
ncbi:uroporphyrinogen-III C-methyltransferase [Serratia microhaemolytica]|uniref:uroporphyrinogen-III C-methyltransferase n=1 Tax=Serratia microhaemolytica TaxID=2675110 RepID=UPI000FDD2D1A|nr:uroporphyrinogen-III C-methyltransferase [Serratia microhaemolytica]